MESGNGAQFVEALNTGIQYLRNALGLLKDSKELMTDPTRREAVESALEKAENQTRIAEAQIAKTLGYMLCRCDFPPVICLQTGFVKHRAQLMMQTKCPKCGQLYPDPKLDVRIEPRAEFDP